MKQKIFGALIAALALSTPAAANTFGFGFQKVGLTATEFEVIPRSRRDVDGYWCAAADYARRALGAGWKQRIYVVRGYGPSKATGRRTSVEFSIVPPKDVPQSTSFVEIGFKPGQSMTVQKATSFCDRRLILSD